MLDRDNDKFITKEDLEIAFREAGEELQPNELDRIFETADADGDGKISLDDYIKLMLVK
jgi:Ca2+-binding EF-hand superfamily protein